MIARAEAQVMRLACLFALLDQSALITRARLLAALAVWDYAEASAKYIFGDTLGDPVADRILQVLRRSPGGITRKDIRDLFKRHRSRFQIERALSTLADQQLADCVIEKTKGRPVERWFAMNGYATKGLNLMT
jgi:hypothetical protein